MLHDPRKIVNSLKHLVTPNPDASLSSCFMRLASLVLVAGISLLVFINQERMEDIASLGYIGAFFVMLLSNATLVLPAPGLIFVFALGSSLNPFLVGICAGLGAALGEITGYLTGYNGLGIVENNPIAQRVKMWMDRNGMLTVVFTLSIIPSPLSDFAGILSGAGRVPLWRFMSISIAAKILQSGIIALAGSQLR
jgi:uncharacterized membrane protein YdjX (TVP38/TMEM64 family)